MYSHFGLVLMVNHACNLRCSYCYTGLKFTRAMPAQVARKSVDRAHASLGPGGTLELSFFGGEPLLEPALIEDTITYARSLCAESRNELVISMTTNGTIDSPQAIRILLDPELDLTVSFDGLPELHDRHRIDTDGRGSSARVLATIKQLIAAEKVFQVIMVVRPDTVAALPDGLRFLRDRGVDMIVPSLDLWTAWTAADLLKLEAALEASAQVWRDGLPRFGVSWFNEKAVELAGVPLLENARCGFGKGEIAVAPSGNLYPCERLIGIDAADNPMKLPGTALDGEDFVFGPRCDAAIFKSCGLSCSCSNYVRSGRIDTADNLLQALDQICLRETRRVLMPQKAAS
jgi:uncharacterized protein